MNLPNKLTLFRILMVPVFLVLFYASRGAMEHEAHATAGFFNLLALILVIIVTYTDWLDGKLARERNLITSFGRLFDPLADKIFVTGVLVVLSEADIVPAWAVIIILAREFLITGLRMLGMEQQRLIGADRLGKHKTGWQLAVIISTLVAETAREFLIAADVYEAVAGPWLVADFFWLCVWIPLSVTLVLTVASGWNYMRSNADLYLNDM